MGTNYHAHIARDENDLNIHLCKTSGRVTSISGVLFDAWEDMKTFLVRNEQFGLTITSEYGTPLTVAEFIEMVEDSSPADRRRQYDMVAGGLGRGAGYTGVPGPGNSWLDPQGFSMSGYDYF